MDTPPPSSPETANARTLIIETVAKRYGLPPELAVAIAKTESGLDRFAFRVEPAYRFLWDLKNRRPYLATPAAAGLRTPPPGFPSTELPSATSEWIGQQSSWGVMQVMGAVAREFGLKGSFAQLCQVDIGSDHGCRLLQRYQERYYRSFGWKGVIAAYNAGSPRFANGQHYVNQEYVDRVLANGAARLG